MKVMKTKIFLLTFTMCLAVGAAFSAPATKPAPASNANPLMGTWKLNEAKSSIETGTSKNNTVVYSAMGDQVKIVVDGTDTKGKPSHHEWVGKFDGKFYRVKGDSMSDMRAYKKINDRTLDFTVKHHGAVTVTGHIMVSADGKSRTVTTRRVDVNGRRFASKAVYDKK